MFRKLLTVCSGATLAASLLIVLAGGPAEGVPPVSTNNCVAQAGTSCTFTPDNVDSGADGYIDASDAAFTITAPAGCALAEAASPIPADTGPEPGTFTTDPTTGTTTYRNATADGGAGSLTYTLGCTYTLTVAAGNGAVAGGQTN